MENKTESEAHMTKKTPTKKDFVKWILCWFCLGFLFLFFSNIFMHLFTSSSTNTDKNRLTLREYENCEIGEDGQYIHIEDNLPMQLTYSISDPSKEISKIVIDFGKPISQYLWIELYYPDEEGNYPQEYARKERLVAGLTEHMIDIEEGKYPEIRIKFVYAKSIREVFIKELYAGETGRRMLYADKAWRYRIWGVCLLCSFVLSVFLFVWEKFRTLWSKLCRKSRSFVLGFYVSIDINKILKIVAGGILISGCLESIAMLAHFRKFNGKEALIYFVLGMLLLSFFVFREAYTKRIECVLLLVFLLLAFTFICVIPISLGMSQDDDTHYYHIISMARAVSGTITEADDFFDADVNAVVEDEERFQRDHSKVRADNYNEKYRKGAVLKNRYVFNYKHIPYLPFVMGIWFSYGLGLSFCMTAFMAKVFQILFIGTLIFASMKNLKSGNLLLFTFVMVPTVLFLTVSYGYDSWLTFLMIYAFSRYFGELQRKEEKLTFAGFCKIFVPAFLALLPKYVYAPVLFLMAYMPESKWKEKRWKIAYHSCFVIAALCMVFVIMYAASGQMRIGGGDSRAGAGADGDLQLQYIIHHFDAYCRTLFAFLRSCFSYSFAEEYLTYLPRIGSKDVQYMAIALLLTAAVWDRSSVDARTVPILSKLAALIMPVVIAAICATIMYLVFTAVGLDEIKGYNGRYILPAVFPSLFMLSRCGVHTGIRKKMIPIEHNKKVLLEVSAEELGNMTLVFLNVCFLLYNLWLHCGSKY